MTDDTTDEEQALRDEEKALRVEIRNRRLAQWLAEQPQREAEAKAVRMAELRELIAKSRAVLDAPPAFLTDVEANQIIRGIRGGP